MKKIFALLLTVLVLVSGCGKYTEKDVIKDFENKIEKATSYKLSGDLEIVNNEDVYNYDVEVSYKKNKFYKVSLTNVVNGHTQIILKNEDGVYVLTPALNKSFKFQSDWPYSNSQIYLLGALLNDVKNTENRTFKKTEDGYVFSTNVNYPNNSKLVSQKITLDKDLNVKEVNVYDENDIVYMSMKFNDIDYSPTFTDDYFDLDTVMSAYSVSDDVVDDVMELDDYIYPLVIPAGTKLVSEEKVKKDIGERVIMTFDGDKPFLLVEETVNVEEELTVIPTYGEPYQLMDSLGVMTNNSLSWISNGIEYYIISDVLEQDELIEIAQSINVLPTMK